MPVNLGPFIRIVAVSWEGGGPGDLKAFLFSFECHIDDSSIDPGFNTGGFPVSPDVTLDPSTGVGLRGGRALFVPTEETGAFTTIVFNIQPTTAEAFGGDFDISVDSRNFDGSSDGTPVFGVYHDEFPPGTLNNYTVTVDCVAMTMEVTGGTLPDEDDV